MKTCKCCGSRPILNTTVLFEETYGEIEVEAQKWTFEEGDEIAIWIRHGHTVCAFYQTDLENVQHALHDLQITLKNLQIPQKPVLDKE